MTPEERLRRIENLLQAMMEHHAQRQQQMDKHTEQIEKHTEQIEKQNAGIRDLIVVSRTVLTSIQELREDHKQLVADIKELRDAQAVTDEKLNILIDTVDRIVRHRNGKE